MILKILYHLLESFIIVYILLFKYITKFIKPITYNPNDFPF